MAPEDSAARLERLRGLMKEHNLDAYMVPSEDAHASEYLSPCDARRAFISSFTGSAGVAVVTQTEAKCWTDGRYWLQAGKQLGEGWELMKAGDKDVPPVSKWLKESLPKTSRIGIDPTVLPIFSYTPFKPAPAIVGKPAPPPTPTMVPIPTNLIDGMWTERPSRPANEIFHLADEYTGKSAGEKLKELQGKLSRIGSPGTVISQLDEVAWLFNLRGSDIPYNPVFFAYTIITPTSAQLFLHTSALHSDVKSYLSSNDVDVLEYDTFFEELKSWAGTVASTRAQKIEAEAQEPPEKKQKADPAADKGKEDEEKVVKTDKVIIGDQVSWAIADVLGEDNVEVRRSMICDAKAIKNSVEIEGFRQCHIRDGAALVRYFAWLQEELEKGSQLSEYEAAEKLEGFRAENKLFKGLSFDTISSTGANAAIIHYKPDEEGSAMIDINQIYLCDSGAQYLDGTTDTTRTLHFGTPSEEEKIAFTRVLQGHIELDKAVFPVGTTGYILDVLARKALWSSGLDYRHGTGHGVGSFLNVHEGPQGVGQRPAYNDVPLAEGHVISNEPGYYADGKFGIRIENVQVCKKVETRWNFGEKGYLGFERFTMVPIQTKLVQADLLSPDERKWLNDYHQEVLAKVSPLLQEFKDERALSWLQKECQPL